ncbi:MAG: kelch repeat-containing protein [Pirellulales bacterium]
MRYGWLLIVLSVVLVSLSFGARASAQPRPVGQWRVAASMHERREYAGGVRLKDGRILAVSGHPLEGRSIASAELYDPQTDEWTITGALRQPRNGGNSATRLMDGRVLLAGGHSNDKVVSGAELYDPTTGRWTDAGTLRVGRDPMATLLADGRVLVAGGIDWYTDTGKIYAVSEIYDPKAGDWTITGSLLTPRDQHRMVLLDDSRVLAVAGYAQRGVLLASAELYDPTSGHWQATEDLPKPRAWFGLAKLQDGRILVAGGYTGNSSKPSNRTYLASVVLYDPKTGHWSETNPMHAKRAGFSITLLSDSQVLVAGGVAESGAELKSAEIFDPRTETWLPATSMDTARRNHRATLLRDGSVLVIGGSNLFGNNYLTSCEIFSF